MSGRSGYRKTNRRIRATPRAGEALRRIRGTSPAWPPHCSAPARFRLPPVLAFAVAPGPHGHGVIVHPGAGVEVIGRSREHVIRLAAFFFAMVARDRLPFSVVASIGPVERPGQADTYHLSVVGGAVIASRTAIEPVIIDPTQRF
jgi:hypothetical protein